MTEAVLPPGLAPPAAGISLPLSREQSTPLYDQLRQAIADRVLVNRLEPGDALPSEHQLCEEFGVSRTVVRQALAQLENEGLVLRVKGKGTFVAEPKTGERFMPTLLGLYDDARQRGGVLHSEVLDHRLVPASAEISQHLQIAPGEPVVQLYRLRHLDGEPWALSTSWLPERIGRVTFEADMTSESLYRVLERRGFVGHTGWRSVEAVVADPDTANLLGTEPGKPVLKLKSLRRDERGEPIDFFEAYHRGDRSRFEFELTDDQTVARVLSQARKA